MRSFGRLAFRQLRARRARALMTTAGIVLGVGMIFGVLALSTTINRTFTQLFDSVYGKTDLIVSGDSEQSVRKGLLERVRGTEGVEVAVGRVFAPLTLLEDSGEAIESASGRLNMAGTAIDDPDLTGATIVAGRDLARGGEVTLQQSWAESNEIEVGDRIRLATPTGVISPKVAGLFEFPGGLDFGGEGFGQMPLERARKAFDRRGVFDEINVALTGQGGAAVERVRRALAEVLPRGAKIDTPTGRGEEVQEQLQAFNVVLYFFAAMALFVGGFLIFNAFNMTVLQRTRELGMLRTLGATRAMVIRSVLTESAVLGALGGALGIGLGIGLAVGLAELMGALGFPIGGLVIEPFTYPVAVGMGIVTAIAGSLMPARRAGRTSPIRAVLGGEGIRIRPRRRRALIGLVLIIAGAAGAFWLGAADETTPLVAAAGMGGVIAIFFGISMIAPHIVTPIARIVGRPLRLAFPVEGRLAAEATAADPSRTAATATGLMIGLALVVAVNGLGASFLNSIESELDATLERDLTVQPRGFSPGQGPQESIALSLERRLARIPEVDVASGQTILFTPDLPGRKGKTTSDGLLLAFEPETFEQVDDTPTQGVSQDELFDRIGRGLASIGEGWADEQELETGDPIVLEGPAKTRRTEVAGIVESTLFAGQVVGMSRKTMRQVYGVRSVSEIALKARDADAREAMTAKVERIVERDHPNLTVLSNEELKEDIESQLSQTFGFFNAIVGVAIFASLFGIINTLSMSVYERTREIGVLRALGSSRRHVRRQVAFEAMVIGLIGALLGVAVGAGLGWALLKGLGAGIPGVTYEPPWLTMAVVGVSGVVLGRLAAVIPARRAARLNVVDALSYE